MTRWRWSEPLPASHTRLLTKCLNNSTQVLLLFLSNPLLEGNTLHFLVHKRVTIFSSLLGGVFVCGLVNIFHLDSTSKKTRQLMGFLQGLAAGFMLFMTCFHLMKEAEQEIGQTASLQYFFIGVALFGLLEYIANEDDEDEDDQKVNQKVSLDQKELDKSSIVTFIAMALHNIPEGLSIYLTCLSNPVMGAQMALAIMLHKIPEGMAVALPLYASTGSSLQVMKWTLLNAAFEPLGVLLGGLLLTPYLSEAMLCRSLAMVSGLMFAISIHELLPVAVKYSGKDMASISLFLGMALCGFALEMVEAYSSQQDTFTFDFAQTMFPTFDFAQTMFPTAHAVVDYLSSNMTFVEPVSYYLHAQRS